MGKTAADGRRRVMSVHYVERILATTPDASDCERGAIKMFPKTAN